MNNADQPAYPHQQYQTLQEPTEGGLTKRDRFAMAAMEGLWSSDTEFEMTPDSVASLAVE